MKRLHGLQHNFLEGTAPTLLCRWVFTKKIHLNVTAMREYEFLSVSVFVSFFSRRWRVLGVYHRTSWCCTRTKQSTGISGNSHRLKVLPHFCQGNSTTARPSQSSCLEHKENFRAKRKPGAKRKHLFEFELKTFCIVCGAFATVRNWHEKRCETSVCKGIL